MTTLVAMRITDKRHHYVPTPEETATLLMQQLAWRAVGMGYMFPRKGRQSQPGEMIKNLPPEQREILQHLRSGHFAEGELPGLALVGEVCEFGVTSSARSP